MHISLSSHRSQLESLHATHFVLSIESMANLVLHSLHSVLEHYKHETSQGEH